MQSIDVKYVNNFTGYKNYRDVTNLKTTDITAGSQNIFIDDGAKLSCRGGMDYLGAPGTTGTLVNPAWTLPHRIHSDYDKFVNNQGTIMPFRVYYSGTTGQGDVMEVWLPDFVAGVPQVTKRWYQVTANAPASPINSTHKWYFAEWYDWVNTQNRIVFTYGTTNISSYSGGYAPITAKTGITLVTNGTWRSKGFIEAPEGVNSVTVNGITYALTAGDFSTNTITVASTVGANVDDVAFQTLNIDTASFGTADVCSSINNQVYYMDWKQRNVFVSWNRNRPAELGDTFYTGTSGLDDAVFTMAGGGFTGNSTDTFIVSIDSVVPTLPTFTGTGANGLVFDYSGYTQGGNTNDYKVIVYQRPSTSSNTITYDAATGFFWEGETVTGGTSGATGVVVWDDTLNKLALTFIFGGPFTSGEVITGGTSGVTATVVAFGPYDNNRLEYYYIAYKNDVNINSGPLQGPTGLAIAGPFAVGDGITFDIPTDIIGNSYPTGGGPYNEYQGFLQSGDTWEFTITDTVDTFSATQNGVRIPGFQLTGITGGIQALADGVRVDFVKTTGHAIGDSWRITAYNTIIKGWRDFYYTQPVRLPGEGYRIQLDSNGWTMQPQEQFMYMNSTSGEYYTAQTHLSSDLQSETFLVERLKTEQQNKALFPYLMSSTKNFLSIISTEKTWDIMGRQKFLELPQSKTLSDYVRVDFETSDWEDANIKYIDRKMYFILPKEGYVFIYDDFMKYWHAPMTFGRRVASISFIDGRIVGHSNERNESYDLFTSSQNDLGIYPLDTRIISSYYDFGKRFQPKAITALAIDGYMDGNPQIFWKVNAGLGGCEGVRDGVIDPLVCLPIDLASLGKSSLGYHGLGNAPVNVINHFMYGTTMNDLSFYLRNIEITCNSADQRWSITSYGTNLDINKLSNTTLFNR